ncbi:hypothetical protein SBD_4383 [Streptomyces bottropensis ATCC 25435]|uniref:Uncharacterized protein n=1 Tax=Streptomyces bottropensis ATCC 25435 TaxID=1054862 RepID=M3FP31_9ACTN|nr:hypothetical protein SBD_4383 [Streptomyces bottropensis ATCC 25435]
MVHPLKGRAIGRPSHPRSTKNQPVRGRFPVARRIRIGRDGYTRPPLRGRADLGEGSAGVARDSHGPNVRGCPADSHPPRIPRPAHRTVPEPSPPHAGSATACVRRGGRGGGASGRHVGGGLRLRG